jgi:hypothetical protein
MKKIAVIVVAVTGLMIASCSQRLAYTEEIRKEYDLNAEKLKKVQFYTSSQIILQRSTTNGSQEISEDGKLVQNQKKEEDRLIINPSTKCIFEKFGDKGEVLIRFEVGQGKTLKFAVRQNQSNGRFYLDANWKSDKGGEVQYGNQTYYANSASGNTFLMVSVQKLKKTKRKDRVVKGIKV